MTLRNNSSNSHIWRNDFWTKKGIRINLYTHLKEKLLKLKVRMNDCERNCLRKTRSCSDCRKSSLSKRKNLSKLNCNSHTTTPLPTTLQLQIKTPQPIWTWGRDKTCSALWNETQERYLNLATPSSHSHLILNSSSQILLRSRRKT